MHRTADDIRATAHVLNNRGMWTGKNFLHTASGRVDLTLAAHYATGGLHHDAFATDEPAAADLITTNPRAMAVIHLISNSLRDDLGVDTPDTNGRPDPIEHVAQWAAHGLFNTPAPSEMEVIGRLLRIANALDLQHHLDHVDRHYPTPHAA